MFVFCNFIVLFFYIFVKIKFTMKKLFAFAFIGGLVLAGCSKKETSTESNRMLEEPEAEVTVTAPAATPVAADSTVVK